MIAGNISVCRGMTYLDSAEICCGPHQWVGIGDEHGTVIVSRMPLPQVISCREHPPNRLLFPISKGVKAEEPKKKPLMSGSKPISASTALDSPSTGAGDRAPARTHLTKIVDTGSGQWALASSSPPVA
jgi:hypothetical protein